MMYLLSVLLPLLYCSTCYCQFPPNCEKQLYTLLELQENPDFISLVETLLGDGNQVPDPIILDLNFTCLAQGPTQGLYRATSVIVDFMTNLFPGDTSGGRRQCQFLCRDNEWRSAFNDGFISAEHIVVLDPPIRYDCANCRDVIGNDYNCIREFTIAYTYM